MRPLNSLKVKKAEKRAWKEAYMCKLINLMEEYPKFFIVGADNVSSRHMQNIRQALRKIAVLFMGKNTLKRKAILDHFDKNPSLGNILPYIKGNTGFVFTHGDLSSVKDIILSNKVKANAKAGAISPYEVVVKAQNTGIGPEKTSFFQSLAIPTKISKGTIEIISPVQILKAGEKIGPSEALLLNMLNISPLTYGLSVIIAYESGTCFDPAMLDIKHEDLLKEFVRGGGIIAAVCLEINYPIIFTATQILKLGITNVFAIAASEGLGCREGNTYRDYIRHRAAYTTVAPPDPSESGSEPISLPPSPRRRRKFSDDTDEGIGFDLYD